MAPRDRDAPPIGRRPHLPTSPGIGAPPAPSFKTPVPTDSFPALDENDRYLLQNVLRTAQSAIEAAKEAAEREARERITLEGKLKAKISEVEEDVKQLEGAITELRGVSGDLRNLNGSINTLNSNVMEVLRHDSDQERRMGEMKLEMERAAHREGSKAGAKWGSISAAAISVLTGVVYLVMYVLSVAKGAEPPKPPALPGAASHASH